MLPSLTAAQGTCAADVARRRLRSLRSLRTPRCCPCSLRRRVPAPRTLLGGAYVRFAHFERLDAALAHCGAGYLRRGRLLGGAYVRFAHFGRLPHLEHPGLAPEEDAVDELRSEDIQRDALGAQRVDGFGADSGRRLPDHAAEVDALPDRLDVDLLDDVLDADLSHDAPEVELGDHVLGDLPD